MWKKGVWIICIAFATGGFAGWMSVGERAGGMTEEVGRNKGTAVSGTGDKKRWTTREFLEKLTSKDGKEHPGQGDWLTPKLKDWTDEEIRRALEASLKDREILLASWPTKGLPGMLMVEWMNRDIDGAMAWFDQLESPALKANLASVFCGRWPAEHIEKGLAYLVANRAVFESFDWPMMHLALKERGKQGVAGVEDLIRFAKENGLHFVGNAVELPEDFDYATLVKGEDFKGMWERGEGRQFLSGWYQQDRDAMFDWMLEEHGVAGLRELGYVTQGGGGDYLGQAAWYGGRIEQMGPEQRAELMDEMGPMWARGPLAVVNIVKGVKDPAVQDELQAVAVQGVFSGVTPQVVKMLEEIQEPARRVELLENASVPAFLTSREYQHLRMAFRETDEALLRSKLAEWQASPEQVDAIIARVKPPVTKP